MQLYVGIGASGTRPGVGPICCSAAVPPAGKFRPRTVLLDSGAFTDRFAVRLSPLAALRRMQHWEKLARRRWGGSFRCQAWVAYDRLVDHHLTVQAWPFIEQTIWACRVFHLYRAEIEPRILVMPLQGTNPEQYEQCAQGVLPNCQPHDWVGLGGWCYLGRNKSHFPLFQACMQRVLPLIAAAGIQHVHIFGVTWFKALAELVHQCKPIGLHISTDSSIPLNPRNWTEGWPRPFQSPLHAVRWYRRKLKHLATSK